MFKVMLDRNFAYTSKPSREELSKYITKRLLKYPTEITAEQLAHELTMGKSFTPAYFGKMNSRGYLARSEECWSSQQVICLDFDNTEDVPDPHDPKKKKKVKKVSLTWDAAKEEFKHTAMFMYKSFSNIDGDPEKEGHPKFRVVLAFDTVIDDIALYKANAKKLLLPYPYADQSTTEPHRPFYGGTGLHIFDYSNRLPVVPISQLKEGGFTAPNTVVKNSISNWGRKSTPLTLDGQSNNNLDSIRNKNTTIELSIIPIEPTVFNTRQEAYHYLKQINLHEYLGIYSKSTLDIFHEESTPSGSIYQDPNTGYWWYKCWSSSHPWKGTITDITERLTNLSRPKTIEYLSNVFNFRIEKTVWQKEQEEIFQYNLDFLNDEKLIKEVYPYFDSIMKSKSSDSVSLYYSLVREIHLIALENVSSFFKYKDHENAIFYVSINYIMQRLNRFCAMDKFLNSKRKRIMTILSLLVYLKIIQRLDYKDIPPAYAAKAEQQAKSNGYSNGINFYSIPSYAANLMIDTEQLSKQFKDLGMTVTNFDRQMILNSCGEEEADRVFPMRKKEKIAELNIKTCNEIEKVLVKYIEEYGWVTEDRIIQNVPLDIDIEQEMRKRNKAISETDVITEEDKFKWAYNYKKGQLKRCMRGLLTKYGLDRKMLNNKLMEQKEIPMHFSPNGNPSYPAVIYK